eukprot:gene27651-31242_t
MGFIKNLFARSNQDALQEAAPDSEFASYGAGTAAAAAPATASSASASAAAPADVPATPSDSDAGEAGAPLRLRDALRRRGSGGASDNAPGIKLPLIGHLPAQRQLSILSTVLAACILLSVGAVGLNIRNSSVTSAQTQIAADALMHSQRVGKAAPNAVQGNPEAFRQLEDSRKELNQDFKLMQAGGVYQGRNVGSPNAAMASAVAAARKVWDTTERSSDTILRLKPELTGLEKTLRQLDRLSPAVTLDLSRSGFDAAIGHLDFDSKKDNTLAYETISGRKTYQVIAGDSWEDVVGSYTSLTGRQPLPPRWAFGNFASRFGYHTEQEARDVVKKFADEKIPLDAIVFDLYWFGKDIKGTMGNLAFDKDNFPNPKKMISDFSAQGVKTVLITEPFVVTTSSKWQDAVASKALATDASGTPARYDFYFGNTGLIDIYSKEGKDWFWNIYKGLRNDYGVAGWWGDLGYGIGQFAPGIANPAAAVSASHQLLLSHGLAMQAMRAQNVSAKLGIVLNQWTASPATGSAADVKAAEVEWAHPWHCCGL